MQPLIQYRQAAMPLWNEFRFALRQLRKTPTFTAIVLGTLALCIGANTAIYSVLDAVLVRPLPYPDPDRLALVTTEFRRNGAEELDTSQTGAQFEGVRDGAHNLDVAAYSGVNGVNFATRGHAEYAQQQRVSAGFFHVLGVAPRFGREFTRAEDVAGGPALAILSDSLWRRVFDGNPAVVGQAINLRGAPYTIVGIMPPGFRVEEPVDVWTPLRPSRTGEGGGSNYDVIARPKLGVPWVVASEELKALSPSVAAFNLPRGATAEERLIPLRRGITYDQRPELMLTWAAVLAVLLIGCVNIAGLLTARARARSRETATRRALGASRGAIVRGLLIESLLLALGGCAAGLVLGFFALDGLRRMGADSFALWHPIALDARVFLAMLGIALATSVTFGLAPALQTSRIDIRAVLVEGGRGSSGSGRRWSRRALVITEVALSLVLLVSAALLVKTLRYLDGLNPGFDAHNVIAARVSLQDARYRTSEAVNRLYTESLDQIRGIPGVQSAAVALTLPFERPLNDGFRLVEGGDARMHGMELIYVTPGYFEALRIPVLGGREFQNSDTPRSRDVAVVSQSFARRYFAAGEAIGRHLKTGQTVLEIVGVCGDVQQHSGLGPSGPLSFSPTVYVPVAQTSDAILQLVHTWFSPKWVVRASGARGNIETRIRSAVAKADPLLPIAGFDTAGDLQARSTSSQRYHAWLFSMLAGLGVFLAAVGLYGLMSQTIAQRTKELGIRLALGCRPRRLMLGVLGSGVGLAAAGSAAGLVLAVGAVRLVRTLLWGVRAVDPPAFAFSAVLLLLVALAATLAPAARVLSLDPAQTLRDE